jgi:hypothetical protein
MMIISPHVNLLLSNEKLNSLKLDVSVHVVVEGGAWINIIRMEDPKAKASAYIIANVHINLAVKSRSYSRAARDYEGLETTHSANAISILSKFHQVWNSSENTVSMKRTPCVT